MRRAPRVELSVGAGSQQFEVLDPIVMPDVILVMDVMARWNRSEVPFPNETVLLFHGPIHDARDISGGGQGAATEWPRCTPSNHERIAVALPATVVHVAPAACFHEFSAIRNRTAVPHAAPRRIAATSVALT